MMEDNKPLPPYIFHGTTLAVYRKQVKQYGVYRNLENQPVWLSDLFGGTVGQAFYRAKE